MSGEEFVKTQPKYSTLFGYDNPWPSWKGLPGPLDLLRYKLTKKEEDDPNTDWEKELRILKPEFKENPKNGIRVTWLGHATVLVQMDGKAFLTDPIFRMRRKRLRPPPCTVEELPEIDAVVISHNHFDHLDYQTVKDLHSRFGDRLQWFVPAGLAKWFQDSGCKNVAEKSWYEEVTLNGSHVKLVALPCQHWSGRTAVDNNRSLWCSWAILGTSDRFYFAGDTGYCPEFAKIGQIYGHFTLAAIPIGCYKPRWFMCNQHINPQEAVKIHCDIKATKSLGIHWGTYDMGSEPTLEPKYQLKKEAMDANLKENEFFTLFQGEDWFSGISGTKEHST